MAGYKSTLSVLLYSYIMFIPALPTLISHPLSSPFALVHIFTTAAAMLAYINLQCLMSESSLIQNTLQNDSLKEERASHACYVTKFRQLSFNRPHWPFTFHLSYKLHIWHLCCPQHCLPLHWNKFIIRFSQEYELLVEQALCNNMLV